MPRGDDRRLNETLDTNVAGYFRIARAALPHLKRGSSIINTGSAATEAAHGTPLAGPRALAPGVHKEFGP